MPHPLTRRRRKEIASLRKKKEREQRGEVLLEGVRGVESAVLAGAPLVDVLVTEEARTEDRVRTFLQKVDVPVHDVSAREIDQMTDARSHQGILAVARMESFPVEQLHTLRAIVALDGVQDPGNVGAIMRTAAWFGVEAVVAGPGTAGLFGPKVVRAAAGSLWDVHLASVPDMADLLRHLGTHGMARYGADLGGTSCSRWRPRNPSVVVLGSEAHGLSPEVKDVLDERVYIAGSARREGTESLNVAIASGILLYHYAQFL